MHLHLQCIFTAEDLNDLNGAYYICESMNGYNSDMVKQHYQIANAVILSKFALCFSVKRGIIFLYKQLIIFQCLQSQSGLVRSKCINRIISCAGVDGNIVTVYSYLYCYRIWFERAFSQQFRLVLIMITLYG